MYQGARESHADCLTCNQGYELRDKSCRQFGCQSDTSGEACASCPPPEERESSLDCVTCNAGYSSFAFNSPAN